MKKKILDFIKSDNQNYLDFVRDLFPKNFSEILENKNDYKDEWYPKKYFSTGVIKGPLFEVDFNGFSFNHIDRYSNDKRVLDLVKILKELENPDADERYKYRLKKIKIALFLNLGYTLSPLFDLNTYIQIQKAMYKAMERLHNYLKDKVEILMISYDSICFRGEIDFEDLKKFILPDTIKIRKYDNIIKFENLVAYQFSDTKKWNIKYTTATCYDEIKEKIIELLKTEKYEEILNIINNSEASNRKKREWKNHLKEILRKKYESHN